MFCKRKKVISNVKLSVDGELINEVDKTTFLGILIDNMLTWKKHFACIFRGISREGQYLNKQGMISLHYSFIYPYLTYYNHIWGSTYKSSLKRFSMLQNKAIKIIGHARFRVS